jgi:hypothetical protein
MPQLRGNEPILGLNIMEHWFYMKDSHSSDHYNISWLNLVPMFPTSS